MQIYIKILRFAKHLGIYLLTIISGFSGVIPI